jgi:hypothetical protein
MKPVNATRTGRSILAVTPILTIALALGAGAVDPAGSAADGPGGPPGRAAAAPARAADACEGAASLTASEARPRQLRPVRFAASTTVPAASVVFYDFSYGDGSDDAGVDPTAVHAYQESGAYQTKVSIVTSCNTIVSSTALRVVVADGLPPTVAIGYPRANQTVHFGRLGLQLTGTAQDPSGVRRVELAIQLLSVKRAGVRAAASPGCYWYDGHVHLKVRGCARPLFFPVRVGGHRWSFRMNARAQIPPGVYTARVRATDKAGNVTTVFSPKLGNFLAFGLIA